MSNVLGTCSICGGPVMVPEFWGGSIPPTPTCQKCGATKAQPHGPVIPMDRNDREYGYVSTEDRPDYPFRGKK